MKIKDGLNDVFMLLMLAVLFASMLGCTSVKKSMESSYTKTDSSWVTPQRITMALPGGTTPTVNVDSIKEAFRNLLDKPGVTYTSSNDTFIVLDTSGRAELRYWFDNAGQLYANCTAKDRVIDTLISQNNRLIKESKTVIKEKTEVKSNWIQLLLSNASVVAFTLFLIIRDIWQRSSGRDKAA